MTQPPQVGAVLDAALQCAADRHWEAVRLADVAAALGVPLSDLRTVVADKEALVDALWDRADSAMLEKAGAPELSSLSIPAALETLVFAWLEPLQPWRRTAREMLLVRLEPGHFHIQLPTMVRISRSVQWLREAAGLRATFAWRAMEESALTALFVVTVAAWLRGEDEIARQLLCRGLRAGENVRSRIGPRND